MIAAYVCLLGAVGSLWLFWHDDAVNVPALIFCALGLWFLTGHPMRLLQRHEARKQARR